MKFITKILIGIKFFEIENIYRIEISILNRNFYLKKNKFILIEIKFIGSWDKDFEVFQLFYEIKINKVDELLIVEPENFYQYLKSYDNYMKWCSDIVIDSYNARSLKAWVVDNIENNEIKASTWIQNFLSLKITWK